MKAVRNSTVFFLLVGVLGTVFASLLFFHPMVSSSRIADEFDRKRKIVEKLGLTDICLFTEARYTRHATQADLFSPFQNHPGAMEQFPSGSMVLPPPFIGGQSK